jgi:tetratricopeptide (TPR) repeat protein
MFRYLSYVLMVALIGSGIQQSLAGPTTYTILRIDDSKSRVVEIKAKTRANLKLTKDEQVSIAACEDKTKTDEARLLACSNALKIKKLPQANYEKYLFYRAFYNWRLEHWQEAIVDFTHSIEFDAENKFYYAHRAESYQKLGQLEAAIADYGMFIKLDKGSDDDTQSNIYKKIITMLEESIAGHKKVGSITTKDLCVALKSKAWETEPTSAELVELEARKVSIDDCKILVGGK